MTILKAIVCSLVVSVVLSQTFNSPVSSATGISSVTSSNGALVTLTGAGWVVGDSLALSYSATAATAGTPVIAITTLVSTGTGATGVGLVAVSGNGGSSGGTSGYTCAPATAFTGKTNLENQSPSGYPSNSVPSAANVPAACPVDIVTLYSATPGTANSGVAAGIATTAVKLAVNIPVTWTITPYSAVAGGGTQNCNAVSINVVGMASINLNVGGACGVSVAGGTAATTNEKYFAPGAPGTTAANDYAYGFYVNTESTAKVCFQTATQFAAAPVCGTLTTKSAKALSVFMFPLAFVAALLF